MPVQSMLNMRLKDFGRLWLMLKDGLKRLRDGLMLGVRVVS